MNTRHGRPAPNLFLLILSLLSLGAPLARGAAEVPSIRVNGKNLEDGTGAIVQLRGVNVSGLEFVASQGWSPGNPWAGATGDPTPDWSAMKSWKINTVRIPVNEMSWLGKTCKMADGKTRDADPGHNYKAAVTDAVKGASKQGYYVILDLHWTAPGDKCALAQNPMADEDNSITFWSQFAAAFKDRPNVMFELFNEPFFYWLASGQDEWKVLRDGGSFTQYVTGDGHQYQAALAWKSAGMQAMLDAVRASGAKNVVLVGAPTWCQDMSKWLEFQPKDPAHQLAAVWHAYPNSDKLGDPKAADPKLGPVAYDWVKAILNAGVPVVITEFGDHNESGTKGSPFVSKLLPWADAQGASYIGWTWDVWQDKDNVLIKDRSGTPSDGFGEYTHQHFLCRADNGANCR